MVKNNIAHPLAVVNDAVFFFKVKIRLNIREMRKRENKSREPGVLLPWKCSRKA